MLLWITYPIACVFLYPLALLKKKNPSGLFFFFDRYSIGGAQRIHIDILKSIEENYKEVYFTRLSPNNKMKEAFAQIANTNIYDIHFWCDYLLFRLFSTHYYAFYLNRHDSARILSSNSTFFYDMLPHLKKKIKKIELLHNFTFGKRGMEFFGLANYKFLDTRIVYDDFTLSNIKNQYNEYGIGTSYFEKIAFIQPGVDIPPPPEKDFSFPIKILYAGRGGTQKRIYLINQIFERCKTLNLPVQFHFAGSMVDELSDPVKKDSVIHGEISSKSVMNDLYRQANMILLTSSYEGFPMVIKEGMSFGCVPIVTALKGNKMHLAHKQNALLIEAIDNEAEVVKLSTQMIEETVKDIPLLQMLSEQAYLYASKNFTKTKFTDQYRKLLLNN